MYRMIQALVIVVLIGLTFSVHTRLRPHRIDLRPGQSAGQGQSRAWQENVFSPRNYDQRGKRLLLLLVVLQILTLVTFVWYAST